MTLKLSGGIKKNLRFIFMSVIGLIVSGAFIAVLGLYIYLLQYALSSQKSYGIVFDAGSTHTSMYIYNWPSDKSSGSHGTASVVQLFDEYRTPGISDIKNFSQINHYFTNFTQLMLETVPNSAQQYATFKFGATAGMRLLKLQDFQFASELFSHIFKYFSDTPFLVRSRNVQVITGKDEGLYAWISANIISESVPEKNKDAKTVGIVEMGGASSQIAYETNDTLENPEVAAITLFGQKYNVYAKSSLCSGKEQSLKIYLYNLIKGSENGLNNTIINISDPCQFRDSQINFPLREFVQSPCVKMMQWNISFNEIEGNLLQFIGTGNYKICRDYIEKAFDLNLLNFTISPSKNYFALGAFIYVIKNLRLNPDNVTMESVHNAINMISNLTFREVASRFPEVKLKYIRTLMYDSLYVMRFLSVVGFSDKNISNLRIVKDINNKEVNWAFGYMVNETNLIDPIYPQMIPSIKTIVTALILILLIGAVVIGIVCFIYSFTT